MKYVLVGIAFFLAVTAAFYGGVFVGRAKPDTPGVLPPPPADHWTYPDSKELMRSGDQEKFLAVFVTPDDFDAVARFYHRQISQAGGLPEGNIDALRAGLSSSGFGRGTYCYAVDAGQPDGKPRKARDATFAVRSQGYDLNVFVSRAEGEAYTHITLTLDPKER